MEMTKNDFFCFFVLPFFPEKAQIKTKSGSRRLFN